MSKSGLQLSFFISLFFSPSLEEMDDTVHVEIGLDLVLLAQQFLFRCHPTETRLERAKMPSQGINN